MSLIHPKQINGLEKLFHEVSAMKRQLADALARINELEKVVAQKSSKTIPVEDLNASNDE